jgi:hypothetical protein
LSLLKGHCLICDPFAPGNVNSNNFETLSSHELGKQGFAMRKWIVPVIVASLLLLQAQQDIPLKGPGRFQATATGLLKGAIQGDISGTKSANGSIEIFVAIDSLIMMSQNVMVSAVISLPAGKLSFPMKLTPANTRLQIEKLDTQELLIVPASGFIEMKGRDLVDGRFAITSSDAKAALDISGEFRKAPIIAGLAQAKK